MIKWNRISETVPSVGTECLCKIIEDPSPDCPYIIHSILIYKEFNCDGDDYPWYDRLENTSYKLEYVNYWIALEDLVTLGIPNEQLYKE